MVAFFSFAGLALFWIVFIWLVKRERGWVGISEATRLRLLLFAAMARIANAITDSLLPAFEAVAQSMVRAAGPMRDLNDALERSDIIHVVGEPGEPPFENDWRNA